MPWWDMARKIDSLDSAGVFSTSSGLKLFEYEVRSRFIRFPFTTQVDYDHPVWFRDRRGRFLMPWWDLTCKSYSLG